MAEILFINRYKSYKAGIENLVRWITRTESTCSNAAGFLRTLATSERSASTLTTRDLITLTTLIVANVTVEIPEDILRTTQDVVSEREFCANWYRNQNMKGELTEINETHTYFIGTLHEIYGMVCSAHVSQQQEASQQPSENRHQSIPSTFTNSFRHLEVEEPDENPLGMTTGSVEGFTALDKLDSRLEKQKGDKAFAIWCLLEDFSAVRK